MKILIADDHAVVRRGLQGILADAFPKLEVGDAGTAPEALEKVWKEAWDVVLLDVTMPGRSGLDILTEIKAARPKLPVLVLSLHPEERFAARALRAGASGYLTKNSAPEDLVTAIKTILNGRKYVSASLSQILAAALEPGAEKALHEHLSEREFQVMQMIALGKSVKEIGAELSLSPKTVSTYRERILEKTKMTSNAQIMRYAVLHGLVD